MRYPVASTAAVDYCSSVYYVDFLDQLCLKVSLGLLGASFGLVIERWLLESLGIWWADCILTYVRIHIFFFLSFGYDVATSLITYVSLESEVGEQKT